MKLERELKERYVKYIFCMRQIAKEAWVRDGQTRVELGGGLIGLL